MKTIGMCWCLRTNSSWRSSPDIPGIATSRTRHRVLPTKCESRNASADEKVSAAKPNCRSKSGSDSRTDSSSSTTDTSECSPFMWSSYAYRLRHASLSQGNRKCKAGARPVILFDPKTATMPLDDGTAHGKPDPYAATFRRVERIKHFGRIVRIYADADVADRQTNPIACILRRADEQISGAIVNVAHCVCCVHQQVQNHLLKLNTIA